MSLAESLIKDSFDQTEFAEEKARRDNVQKLIDFYNGNQNKYTKQFILLSDTEDFPYYYSNITKRIINKVSGVYTNPAQRLINEKVDENYNDVTKSKNVRLKVTERQSRLLGIVGLRPFEVNGVFDYSLIRDFQVFFEVGKFQPSGLKYVVSNTNEIIFECWTDEEHFFVNNKGDEINMPDQGFESGENPYGVIPFVWCHSEELIDDFYNTSGNADDLIEANLHVNMKMSELAYKYRYVAFNPPYVTGQIDENQLSWGYNKILNLQDIDAKAGTFNTMANLIQDIETIKFDIQAIERNYHLNIAWGIDGSPSGFSLIVQNIDHTDDVDDFKDVARLWEQRLYEMEKIVGGVDGIKVKDGDFRVDFADVSHPTTVEEETKRWDFEFKNGLSSRSDYLKDKNPEMSDDQAEEKLRLVAEENRAVTASTRLSPVQEVFGDGVV